MPFLARFRARNSIKHLTAAIRHKIRTFERCTIRLIAPARFATCRAGELRPSTIRDIALALRNCVCFACRHPSCIVLSVNHRPLVGALCFVQGSPSFLVRPAQVENKDDVSTSDCCSACVQGFFYACRPNGMFWQRSLRKERHEKARKGKGDCRAYGSIPQR